VAVVSGGLDAGLAAGKWGAPELLGAGGLLNAADFDDPTRDIAIFNRYKALWSLATLQSKFDNLALLQVGLRRSNICIRTMITALSSMRDLCQTAVLYGSAHSFWSS